MLGSKPCWQKVSWGGDRGILRAPMDMVFHFSLNFKTMIPMTPYSDMPLFVLSGVTPALAVYDDPEAEVGWVMEWDVEIPRTGGGGGEESTDAGTGGGSGEESDDGGDRVLFGAREQAGGKQGTIAVPVK